MIVLRLFLTFLKIGIFTFGGGYAMIALMQDEVVTRHGWLTAQEFTDVLAVSQMTPGPIGINTATYVGYTAMANAGYAPGLAVCGSLLCSLAVIMLPMLLMILVLRWMLRHKNDEVVQRVMRVVRLAVVGLIASAALMLLNVENFGVPGFNRQFVASIAIFVAVFVMGLTGKGLKPIPSLIAAGVLGVLLY